MANTGVLTIRIRSPAVRWMPASMPVIVASSRGGCSSRCTFAERIRQSLPRVAHQQMPNQRPKHPQRMPTVLIAANSSAHRRPRSVVSVEQTGTIPVTSAAESRRLSRCMNGPIQSGVLHSYIIASHPTLAERYSYANSYDATRQRPLMTAANLTSRFTQSITLQSCSPPQGH